MAEPGEYHYPCDSCGADLRFAPGQTQLVCDHCGHTQQIVAPTANARRKALGELDLNAALHDDLPEDHMATAQSTHCPNCGAVIAFSGANHATECPFCASPVVVDSGASRRIKPQALVPFQLTEDQARRAMNGWLGSLWFAPSGLVEYARKGRAMTGVYVPFWTFDAATQSRYQGERGDHYYETQTVQVVVNGKRETRQEQVQKTRWTRVSGRVARDFDDVLVMASSSLPRRIGDDLTPWDLGTLVPYAPDYLSGFQAEAYTLGLAEGQAEARQDMARVIENDVRSDIGGDVQRVAGVETDYRSETFKHILLPVWMAAYKYGGRSFRFVVNGQTGEVQGERPWSAWKIAAAVILAAALIAAVAYIADPDALGLPRPDWLDLPR